MRAYARRQPDTDIGAHACAGRRDVAPYSQLSTPSTVAELVEAAARAGERGIAERALERLTLSTPAQRQRLGARGRGPLAALLSDGDTADRLYQEAIERLRRTRVRVQLARTHLIYGEWLRRERRRIDAREQLRTAFEMFTAMGLEAFAGRAERELLATGERVRTRIVETRDDLTAQEAQVARLARDGLSNVEIGAAAVHQPAHRRLPPAQGVQQARHHLAQPTRPSAARPRRRPADRVTRSANHVSD